MGCRFCTSGLGENCDGPLGCDDIEVGCDCECHKCPDCHSAYCESMGGDQPCENPCDEEEDHYLEALENGLETLEDVMEL